MLGDWAREGGGAGWPVLPLSACMVLWMMRMGVNQWYGGGAGGNGLMSWVGWCCGSGGYPNMASKSLRAVIASAVVCQICAVMGCRRSPWW